MSLFRCRFPTDPELLEALSDCLFEAGAEGLEEGLSGYSLTTYVASAEEAQRLVAAYDDFCARVLILLPEASFEAAEIEAANGDWEKTWLDALEPQAITQSFVLRPRAALPAPAGEQTVWFEPSASFGAGSHPTTRLAAQAIETEARRAPGRALLDVGSGNGVLCLVGLLSGLGRAVGVDTNPVAAEALTHNAALNGVSDRVASHWGSIETVTEVFPLVVANIERSTLMRLAPELCQRLAPAGQLWLTGLLDEDAAEVRESYVALGLVAMSSRSLEGWTLLELTKPS